MHATGRMVRAVAWSTRADALFRLVTTMAPVDDYDEYDYKYCMLDNPSKDVRILKFTSAHEYHVEIELDIVQPRAEHNNNPIEYNALSWCWRTVAGETETLKEPIVIVHHEKKYKFTVSKSLADALRALRQRAERINRLWVDWICINQKNIEERNNQVQLMSVVYGEARCVYVWLGQHTDDSAMAFKFIPELLDLDKFPNLVKKPDAHHWNALKQLMMRDWFSRRWVFVVLQTFPNLVR